MPGWGIGVLMLSIFCFNSLAFAASPNDVIINEYNESGGTCGTPEWVELLVVNGPLTMRNWFLTDEEPTVLATLTDDKLSNISGESIVQFKDNAAFDNIPMGTYIIVNDGTGTDDADFSNGKMEFFIDNVSSTYINRYGTFNLAAGTENLTCYEYTSGDSDLFSNFSGIDHISWGGLVTPPSGVTWGTAITGTEDEDAYFSDGATFNNDDNSKWVINADGTGCNDRTAGAANSGQDDSSLPVELSLFTATSVEKGTKLKWRTESEVNNVGFGIYRSTQENGEYRRIAWVDGQGSTPIAHDYQFVDRKARDGETYYYFLEDVDLEGNTERSEIISITFQQPVAPLDVIPTQFALYQNYPNPFNPETWIPYDLASPATVAMTIYDAQGQVTRTLSLGQQAAGSYRSKEAAIYWDGRNERGELISSGIHFYHLSAGEYHATKKMLILK